VMLANLRLRIPRYARAYLAIQQTGAARLASPEGERAAEFVSRLGPNPVFPVLSDGGHEADAGQPPVRFLFPTTFGDIPHQLRPFSGDQALNVSPSPAKHRAFGRDLTHAPPGGQPRTGPPRGGEASFGYPAESAQSAAHH
jgi:hypothetical protein